MIREEYKEANKGVGWVVLWVIVGVIVAGLIGAAIWGITVATSGVKGQGDGIIKNNSAENWIKQQAKFESLYAEYDATLFRIGEFKKVADSRPDDVIAQTN